MEFHVYLLQFSLLLYYAMNQCKLNLQMLLFYYLVAFFSPFGLPSWWAFLIEYNHIAICDQLGENPTC